MPVLISDVDVALSPTPINSMTVLFHYLPFCSSICKSETIASQIKQVKKNFGRGGDFADIGQALYAPHQFAASRRRPNLFRNKERALRPPIVKRIQRAPPAE